MNCPIDEYKIMAYLDGDFSERENREFIEHISACAECAALLKAYEQQERLLEQYFATRFKEAVKSPKPLIVKASNRPLVLRASLPLYAAAA
ncbi:MAG TPA: zf-HC2 domain-containing protein, partial [Candidatus Sumerlaeota bacterium]|nr:zf-HC2 domain-containing protein [Candidatus Sumerlaeota bacterium]